MRMKIDMNKAYNKLEWSFIECVLKAHGFDQPLCQIIIMFCIQSVSFSILLNDSPLQALKPNRGIRQGDPISPYLFLMFYRN